MTFDFIVKRIQDLIYQQCKREYAIDEVLFENGIDSIVMIEIIVNIENTLNIEFEPDVMHYRTFKSIRTISEYVYSQLSGERCER